MNEDPGEAVAAEIRSGQRLFAALYFNCGTRLPARFAFENEPSSFLRALPRAAFAGADEIAQGRYASGER